MSKSKTKKQAERGVDALINYVNANQASPSNLKELAEFADLDPKVIQTEYHSLTNLYQAVWATFIDKTIETLESELVYAEYSIREKILALYYTLFQELNPHRYFVRYTLRRMKKPFSLLNYTNNFQEHFENYVRVLIGEGLSTEEIQKRSYLDSKYPKVFWHQMMHLLQFWVDDNSKGFENTDAAIEKSVNVAFDLMGYTTFDSMYDFGKFLWNNR